MLEKEETVPRLEKGRNEVSCSNMELISGSKKKKEKKVSQKVSWLAATLPP